MTIRFALCVTAVGVMLFSGCKKDSSPNTPGTALVDTVTVPPGWKLVWDDEFNGTEIDQTKWNFEVNGSGGGNNELQYYTSRPQNAFIDSGWLVIQANEEDYLGKSYTSARMNTDVKGDWTYGRFEARMMLPYGQGLWPAFWMLPTDGVYGGWPMSGEIDIMELLGDNTQKVYGTIHYGTSSTPQQSGGNYSLLQGSFAESFHVFALEWDTTGMTWFVEGSPYYHVSHGQPFDQRFHILLNVAVGGNWPGNPDPLRTIFPQQMKVDYVRAFTKLP